MSTFVVIIGEKKHLIHEKFSHKIAQIRSQFDPTIYSARGEDSFFFSPEARSLFAQVVKGRYITGTQHTAQNSLICFKNLLRITKKAQRHACGRNLRFAKPVWVSTSFLKKPNFDVILYFQNNFGFKNVPFEVLCSTELYQTHKPNQIKL